MREIIKDIIVVLFNKFEDLHEMDDFINNQIKMLNRMEP
jgi:hypothetical protein